MACAGEMDAAKTWPLKRMLLPTETTSRGFVAKFSDIRYQDLLTSHTTSNISSKLAGKKA